MSWQPATRILESPPPFFVRFYVHVVVLECIYIYHIATIIYTSFHYFHFV